jgi:hypothetical protein
MRPIPKGAIFVGRQVKARNSALFSLCAVCGQQKGKQIKPGPILGRRPESGVKCRRPVLAVIHVRKRIMVIHVRVLKCSAASARNDWNPSHNQPRTLTVSLTRYNKRLPSHFKF